MKITTASKRIVCVLGIFLFSVKLLPAVEVSKSELARMEAQVAKENAESKRLQAQAEQITKELKSLSR